MGLEKSIATDYGMAASYWRITGLSADFTSYWAQVTVSGYLNRDVRDSSITVESQMDGSPIMKPAQPLRTVSISLPLTPDTVEVTRDMLYEYLKVLPIFDGALDA